MRRLFPSPPLTVVLFATWLLLNNTLHVAHVVLAALLALAIPWLVAPLRDARPRLRNWATLLRLAAVVLWDIVLANIEVARRILGPERAITPRFVWVPLAIRDPHGIVALAGIITMTPGTISAELNDARTHLLVHAFNLPGGAQGEAELVASIKSRYERPLMEIFE